MAEVCLGARVGMAAMRPTTVVRLRRFYIGRRPTADSRPLGKGTVGMPVTGVERAYVQQAGPRPAMLLRHYVSEAEIDSAVASFTNESFLGSRRGIAGTNALLTQTDFEPNECFSSPPAVCSARHQVSAQTALFTEHQSPTSARPPPITETSKATEVTMRGSM